MNQFGTRVLGLLPARGGSKGLPGKNLAMIAGKPALQWAANALLESELVFGSICSTDSQEIAQTARNCGLSVPFMRPKRLARDSTLVRDVILHSLAAMSETRGEIYDYVALVQATSPTVEAHDIDDGIEMAISRGYDTVISACKIPQRFHPNLTFSAREGEVSAWTADIQIAEKRRQDWDGIYSRSGLFYIFKVDALQANQGFYAGKTGFIEIEPGRAISIDTVEDLQKAREYMGRNSFEAEEKYSSDWKNGH